MLQEKLGLGENVPQLFRYTLSFIIEGPEMPLHHQGEEIQNVRFD